MSNQQETAAEAACQLAEQMAQQQLAAKQAVKQVNWPTCHCEQAIPLVCVVLTLLCLYALAVNLISQ